MHSLDCSRWSNITLPWEEQQLFASSLARLRRDQGRRVEARNLLAPVCVWFTEGFNTPDFKEAKALVETLKP